MRMTTDGQNAGFKIASLAGVSQDAFAIKQFTPKGGTTETKTAPDGRPVHAAPRDALQVPSIQDDGSLRPEKNVTIAVIEPVTVMPMQYFVPKGKVWVTHYINENGRFPQLGVSIIIESLEPAPAEK